MREPDDNGTFRRRIRDFGPFTPDGLATAEEILRRFPVPADAVIPGSVVPNRPDQVLVSFRLSKGLAYRLKAFADMRGISLNRVASQVLAYYVCSIHDDQIKGVHPLYEELFKPEGLKALAQAMQLAYQQTDMPPLVRAVATPSDLSFGDDISQEEKDRLSNW
jgi:hypothetical protein